MSRTTMLIDSLPDGWRNIQLGDLCDRVSDSYRPLSGGDTPYIGLEHLAQGFPVFVGRGIESDIKSQKTAFRANDVLFGKLRPYLRKGAKAGFDGVCSTDILVFRPQEGCDPDFLQYLIHSDSFIAHAIATTTGVQHPRTSWPSLREFKLSAPPVSDQKDISKILANVQKSIEIQEQIIQTTTELKQALMQKLFSEGLRGEPQKETEIGLVPESWEVVDLGAFCRVQSGFAFRSQDYVKGEGGIPITKIGDIQDGFVSYTEKSSYVPEEFWGDRRLDQFKLQAGDVLIALTGATTGKSGVFQHSYRAFLNQRAGRFLPDDEGLKRSFLPFLVRQPYFQIEISSNILVAAQGNISPKRIEKIKVGLPEPTVQEEIASSLDALDRKVACSQAKRSAFQDLFRTLLHELMTAKTRVHELEITA